MDGDSFDEDLRRARAPEDWVAGLEDVWRGHYSEEEIEGAPTPIDEYLWGAMTQLLPIAGALGLRIDTHYLGDEAYLGDQGVEHVREAVRLIGEARRALGQAIGAERAMELAKAEAESWRQAADDGDADA